MRILAQEEGVWAQIRVGDGPQWAENIPEKRLRATKMQTGQ